VEVPRNKASNNHSNRQSTCVRHEETGARKKLLADRCGLRFHARVVEEGLSAGDDEHYLDHTYDIFRYFSINVAQRYIDFTCSTFWNLSSTYDDRESNRLDHG
jgi:hypothetical protein